MTPEAFDELVTEVMENDLPKPIMDHLFKNGQVEVEQHPPSGTYWLGTYQGVPASFKSERYPAIFSDRIILYQSTIEALAHTSPGEVLGAHHFLTAEVTIIDDVKRVIRHVLVHEVAHYLGMDHPQMAVMGYPPSVSMEICRDQIPVVEYEPCTHQKQHWLWSYGPAFFFVALTGFMVGLLLYDALRQVP